MKGGGIVISVSLTQNRIHVSGHANTAPYGSDIVCAAVSVSADDKM